MMEHFCIPEIIGEKVDEEIVHLCNIYPDSLIWSNSNMNDMLLVVKVEYFDTSEVTDMQERFLNSNINADLSN